MRFLKLLFFYCDVFDDYVEIDVLFVGLQFLDGHDVLDCLDNVECFYISSKFTRLDLGIVQQVLH